MSENNSEIINIIGPLCQLLFETQISQNVSKVFSHCQLEVILSDPFDWFVIGYCIANSDNTSMWDIPNIESPRHLQLLSDGLHYSGSTANLNLSPSGLRINMTITNLASEYFKVFPRFYPYTKVISHLVLFDLTDSGDDGFSVLQNLSHYCPSLKLLYLLHGSGTLTELPQLPKETLVTVGLVLPQFNVVFGSLHEYPSLSELHLFSANT